MVQRREPTARQMRLGLELRRLREAAGLTAVQAAALLGANRVQMSHIESGLVGVSEERVRRLASHYACLDAEFVDALVAMATDRTRGWWEEYRGLLPTSFLDLSELNHHASFRRDVAILYVPGVLQTEEYARAVFSSRVPALTEDELELRVRHRLAGQHITVPYELVIHESALRIRVSDRPLDADLVVVDEAPILDQAPRQQARPRPCPQWPHLLFVGDVHQLPSVGAGEVLRDRLAEGSPVTCRPPHPGLPAGPAVRRGQQRAPDQRGAAPAHRRAARTSPLFVEDDTEEAGAAHRRRRGPGASVKCGLDPRRDVQVLAPMHRARLGGHLQRAPPAGRHPGRADLPEKRFGGRVFRVGDKVTQVRNNYEKGKNGVSTAPWAWSPRSIRSTSA
ncbi:ATP-dependent RecD-like DNA helicase [Streptomyces glaucescens]